MVGQALPEAHQGGEAEAEAFLRQEEGGPHHRFEKSVLHLETDVLLQLSRKPVLEHLSFGLFPRQGGPRLRQTQMFPAAFGRVVTQHHMNTMVLV